MRTIRTGVLVIMTMIIIALALPVAADTISIDTDTLPAEVLTQVLKAKQDAPAEVGTITPEVAAEWAEIGKNIGVALSEAAGAMSVGVNEFATTFVGKLTIVLIVWKVIGQDLWAIFGGTTLWVTLASITLWSYRRHHHLVPITWKDGDDEYTEYRTVVNMDSGTAAVSMWVHLVIFMISTAFCASIVF